MAQSPSSPVSLRRVLRMGVLAVASMAVMATAACGSGNGTSADKPSTGSTGKPVTLTYWSWTKGSAEAVAAFNQAHTDIKVKFEEIPAGSAGGYSKISDAIKAGNGPDVFNAEYAALPNFVSSGYVADITDKFTDNDQQGYNPKAVQLTTLGGKEWAVPNDVGVQTMFYRKDLFKKYGLAVPKTWQQFSQEAKQVASAHPGTYLANLTVDDAATLDAMVQQAGGQWFSTSDSSWKLDFNDAGTQQVTNLWQGMIDHKSLSPDASYSTAFNADVAKGKILTILLASWQAAYNVTSFPKLAGKWGVAPMPSFDGQPASGVNGGSSYAINKDSKNIDAAVEFAKWMASDTTAIKARVGDGTSSPYFADSNALQTAKASFKSSYYGNQDLYSVFEQSANGLRPATFGPTQLSLNTFLADKLKTLSSGGKLSDAIGAAHDEAKSEMSSLGLSVQDGS